MLSGFFQCPLQGINGGFGVTLLHQLLTGEDQVTVNRIGAIRIVLPQGLRYESDGLATGFISLITEGIQQIGKLVGCLGALLRLMVLPGLPAKNNGQGCTNADQQRTAVFLPPVLDRLDLFFFGAQLCHGDSYR